MDTASTPGKPSTLMNVAAIAVIVASLLALAVVTGVVPWTFSFSQAQEKAQEVVLAEVPAVCHRCGVIEAIHSMEMKGKADGVRAVVGGAAGAVLGSRIGRGAGHTALVLALLGAAGGVYAGHEAEKNTMRPAGWRVSVRMDDGSLRTVTQAEQPAFAVGEKVKMINGALAARG